MHLQVALPVLTLLTFLSLVLSDSLKTAKDLPSPWKYTGCYQDNGNDRLLPGIPGISYRANGTGMTGVGCVQFCALSNYTIAGLEYGIECYCGRNFTSVPPPKLDKGDCDMACVGNKEEICGGNYTMTVYINKDADVQGGARRLGIGAELIGFAALVGMSLLSL